MSKMSDAAGDAVRKVFEDGIAKAREMKEELEGTAEAIDEVTESTEKLGKAAEKTQKKGASRTTLSTLNTNLTAVSNTLDKIVKQVGNLNTALGVSAKGNKKGTGLGFVVNEMDKAIRSYRSVDGDISKLNKKSNNFFTDLLIGSYQQRQSIIKMAVKDAESQIKAESNKLRDNKNQLAGFNPKKATARSVASFFDSRGDTTALKQWKELDSVVKSVIVELIKLDKLDVRVAHKAEDDARDIIARVNRKYGKFGASIPSNVRSYIDSAGVGDLNWRYKDDFYNSKKRIARGLTVKDAPIVTGADTALAEQIKNLITTLTSGDGIKVTVKNAGADKLYNTAGEFISTIARSGANAFTRDSDNEAHKFGKNFFALMNRGGSPYNKKQKMHEVVHLPIPEADGSIDMSKSWTTMEPDLSNTRPKRDTNRNSLYGSIKDTVRDAIRAGIEEGLSNLQGTTTFSALKDFSDKVLGDDLFTSKISAERRKYGEHALRLATGQADPNVIAAENAKVEQEKIRQEEKTHRARADLETKLDRLKTEDIQKYYALLESAMRKEQADAETAEYKLQKLKEQDALKEEEKRKQRERWFNDEKRFREMLSQYDGKEKTELDKKLITYRELNEELQREYRQAMNNKGNEDAHLRTLRKLQDVQREINKLISRQNSGYEKSIKHLKTISKTTQTLQQIFQRTSAFVGSVTSIASTVRSQAQNLFGYLRNGIRQLTGNLRSQLTSAISAGTEQFDKLEQAKIGFESFYGTQANAILKQVRAEALKTPLVNAGDLADYVSQLAPVSGGDPNLAINATLGALKAIKYSGNDTSEMEYIVKNIRDVIAKGTATAIDIRQFNRALPAMEKALAAMGDSKFLKDGHLTVNKENAKDILQMFANLNTDPSSPVKNISERMLETTAGMKQLFQEIKTNAFETVYADSGIADLVKQFYKMASNQEVWNKFTDSISNFIRNVIDKLKKIKWEELGNRLREGFAKITGTIKTAVATVFSAFGIDTGGKGITDLINDFLSNRKIWQDFWDIIKEFITGFANGTKELISSVKWILSNVDPDFLKKAASVLGYMLSPMGKLWLTLGSLVRDALAGIGRIFGMLNSGANVLQNYQKWKSDRTAAKFANIAGNNLVPNMPAGKSGYNVYGKAIFSKEGTKFYKGGKEGYLRNSAGQFSNWKNLTFREKVSNVGLGSTISSYLKPLLGNAMSAIGIYGLGTAFSNLAGMIVNTVAPSLKILGQDAGTVVSKLGEYGSAAAAGAKVFGPIGALGGVLIKSFADLSTETEKLRKAQEEARKQAEEANRSTMKNYVLDTVRENLIQAGDYKAYEEFSEDAYEEMMKYVDSISDKDLSADPARYMRNAMEAYYKRYGKSKVGVGVMNWIDEGVSGTHAIDKSNLGTLQEIAKMYSKYGFLNLDEDTVKELGNNYESWLGYLKDVGGMDFNSQESLNNFRQTLTDLDKEYDKWSTKKLKLKLYQETEDGQMKAFGDLDNDETFKNWMEDVNNAVFKDGHWYSKWFVDMYFKDGNTGQAIKFDSNPINTTGKLPNTSPLGGGLARGGVIRPIYRANGGGTRGVDTVPAMLQPGEFVMRRSSANKVGMNVLSALNRGDLKYAYRALGGKIANSWNNSRNWNNTVNNNQRSSRAQINIFNRNASQSIGSYYSLANRIALA